MIPKKIAFNKIVSSHHHVLTASSSLFAEALYELLRELHNPRIFEQINREAKSNKENDEKVIAHNKSANNLHREVEETVNEIIV